jgi:CheY-like chemotaxis protein
LEKSVKPEKPAKVLIVEDTDASAEDFRRWLGEDGYVLDRAASAEEALTKAGSFVPDVVVLDLQIPSQNGGTDENIEHGFRTLDELLREKPFRPVVVATAHSNNREVIRRVLQRTRGGGFVFKDARELDRELQKAVAIAFAGPAYRMSKTVAEFKALIDGNESEDEIRKFIHRYWDVILGPEYRDCKSPYEIARGAEIDLLAIRQDGFTDLWELKLPKDPLFKTYNQWSYHSPECAKAVGQLMHYLDLAEREIRPGNLHYDARRDTAMESHRPRGFIVIGRYDRDEEAAKMERERLRLENRFFAGLTILTYDDLIERAEQFLMFLQRYRNGDAST